MVIDFHAHVFEPYQARRIMTDMVARAGIVARSDGTVSGLLRSMDDSGIEVSVISRITTRASQVEAVNEWLLEQAGDRIVPLATLHPEVSAPGDQALRLGGQGFRGIKLHPQYQGFHLDDKRMFPLYEAVEAAGMWILFHAGLDRGLPGMDEYASPERLLRVHRAFPRLRLIAAHMGGEEVYDRTEELLLGRDLYLDTSFVLRKMPPELLGRMVRKHGSERVLFGTDSPWVDQGEDLRFFRELPYLSDEEKERIAWANAAELLGLSEEPHSRGAGTGAAAANAPEGDAPGPSAAGWGSASD